MGKTAGGRLAWADLLRMAALLACLMVWLAEEGLAGSALGSASWQAYQLYNSLLRWCVPVFAMLSGMFLLEPRTGLTLPRLLLGRVLRVLIAIVLWGAVYRLADGLLSGGRFGWGLAASALSAALTGIGKIGLIYHNVKSGPFLAGFVFIASGLEAAFDADHPPFGKVAGDKFAGLPPGNAGDKIRLPFTGSLVLVVAVDRNAEGSDRDAVGRLAQFRVGHQPAH